MNVISHIHNRGSNLTSYKFSRSWERRRKQHTKSSRFLKLLSSTLHTIDYQTTLHVSTHSPETPVWTETRKVFCTYTNRHHVFIPRYNTVFTEGRVRKFLVSDPLEPVQHTGEMLRRRSRHLLVSRWWVECPVTFFSYGIRCLSRVVSRTENFL